MRLNLELDGGNAMHSMSERVVSTSCFSKSDMSCSDMRLRTDGDRCKVVEDSHTSKGELVGVGGSTTER